MRHFELSRVGTTSTIQTINPSTYHITCVWYMNHTVCFSHCFFSWSSLKVVFLTFLTFQHQIPPKLPKTSSAQTSLLTVLLVGPQREFNPIYTPRAALRPRPPSLHHFPLDLLKSPLYKLMIRLLNKTPENDTWAGVKLLNRDPCLLAWP